MTDPGLTIHHLGISQSDRIVWLCEELALNYRLLRYARDPVTRLAPPEYRALHPAGTAPFITDGDVRLAESGAIVEYVIGRHGDGRLALAADHPGYADYLYWFHFANGSMMPSAILDVTIRMLGGCGDNVVCRAMQQRYGRAFAQVEARLGQADYFAGDEFTAADIMMFFPLTTMRRFARREIDDLPSLRAYLARITQRPAFRRSAAKADPGIAPFIE